MKDRGSLVERDFPHLIHDLYDRRWSGVLTLSYMGIAKNVLVEEGRLVFASSSSPDERLGELLLKQGRIGLRQFLEAGKQIGPNRRLGGILVEQGFLTPKELVRAVVEHTLEILYGAFLWTEGQYRLAQGAEYAEAITLNLSTPDIIMEGIRRIDAWSRISPACGGLTAVYERVPTYESVLRTMSLSGEKLGLLQSLATPRDVESLCAESSLTDFEVCRTLWAYRVIGVIHRLDIPEETRVVEDDGLDMVLPQE
jgi:hypothetical protein